MAVDSYRTQSGKDPGPLERLLKTRVPDVQAKVAEAAASQASPEPKPVEGEEATRMENHNKPQPPRSIAINGLTMGGGKFVNNRAVAPPQEAPPQEAPPTPAAEARQDAHQQREAAAEASRSAKPHPTIGEPAWLASVKARLTPEKLVLYEKSRIEAEKRATARLEHRRGPSI